MLLGCGGSPRGRVPRECARAATTLAISNIVIQALTIILGICLYDTTVTFYLVAGVSFTLVMSAVYTWISVSKVLEQHLDPSKPLR